LVVFAFFAGSVQAQFDFEREPISYSRAPHDDPAAQLGKRLEQAASRLPYSPGHGYLAAVLRELGISEKSQVLVFSKTSFQRSCIGPKRPRALYFNDDSYVGWVQEGEVLEVASLAPRLGIVFYTLGQKQDEPPKLARQTDDCLQCHASAMTLGVPGLMVRSIYPGVSGTPVLSAGSFRTTYQSPLNERWGGWYVTGSHGKQLHMGNAILRGTEDPEKFERQAGANLTDLAKRLDVRPYLSPHSDIVALMVLEHQVAGHNQITLASYQGLFARQDQEVLNQMSGKPASEPIASIDRRYQDAAEGVLKCLLFAGEAKLTDAVRGTSGYAEYFSALGPRDKQGRSLRQFDLQTRLFKHPCSYLIYSAAFDALPSPVRSRVFDGLWKALTDPQEARKYPHLDGKDRLAIYDILTETKPGLPDYWKSRTPEGPKP
jgi:hypothetical protein